MTKPKGMRKARGDKPAKNMNGELTPQQNTFLEHYWDPASETYGNVYRSALQAGYSDNYARLLRSPSQGNAWIRTYHAPTQYTEDHIVMAITKIAQGGFQDKDKLQALKLLAQLRGMLVEKKMVATVSIEEALRDLK